jgi:hypothetical protein
LRGMKGSGRTHHLVTGGDRSRPVPEERRFDPCAMATSESPAPAPITWSRGCWSQGKKAGRVCFGGFG